MVELLIVIAILAISASILVPASEGLITRSQLSAAANKTQAGLVFARAEAKRLKQTATFCFIASKTATSCSSSANPAYLGVFQQEELIKYYDFEEGVSVSFAGLSNKIDFFSLGNRQATDGKVYIQLTKKDITKRVEICFNGKISTRKDMGTSEC